MEHCECESFYCEAFDIHKVCQCMGKPTHRTIMGTKICDTCRDVMVTQGGAEYLVEGERYGN